MGKVNRWFLKEIALHQQEAKNSNRRLRLLDIGCGAGLTIDYFRTMGIEAFGVDFQFKAVPKDENFDQSAAIEKGWLKIIEAGKQYPFEQGSFDIVISTQVIEHVEDIGGFFSESARTLKPSGIALHWFPSKFRIIEPHLFMPCIHWLPKNSLRRIAIRLCVALGIEPQWERAKGQSQRERTQLYYSYSVNRTFYRIVAELRNEAKIGGLETELVSDQHPRYLPDRVKKFPAPFSYLVHFALNNCIATFYAVGLRMRQIPERPVFVPTEPTK